MGSISCHHKELTICVYLLDAGKGRKTVVVIIVLSKGAGFQRSAKAVVDFGAKLLRANGKIKYPKMGKKMTHFFCSRLYGLGSFKAVESSFSERKITRRDWDVRSSHAYNH